MTISKAQKARLNNIAAVLENGGDVDGWVQFRSTYRKMNAFSNKKLGVVLKRPGLILEPRTPSFLCVPTVKLGHGWVLQPIARKTRLKEAVGRLERKLKKYRDQGLNPDVHVGNVGWIDDEPLLFDW